MADNSAKVAAALKSMGYSSASVNSAISAAKSGSSASSAAGLLSKNTTNGSSKNLGTDAGLLQAQLNDRQNKTTTATDLYGDTSKVSQGGGVKDYTKYTTQDLGDLAKFGTDAVKMEQAKSGSISKRNDIIAGNLYNEYGGSVSKKNIEDYLNKQAGFTSMSAEDQANTIRAIGDRLGDALKKEEAPTEDIIREDLQQVEGEIGKYKDGDKYVDIFGYDDLSEDYQKYIDQMSEADKKYISNMWAAGMQEQVKTYLDYMRTKEQKEQLWDKQKELYDIERESSLIQAEQTLRQSKEQVENLKQNWKYLGNMGMPGLSEVKIQAVSDSIKEAETTLGEIKKLQQLSLDAQEKQRDIQATQYAQQISNLMYDLNWKVSQEIQNALNKYTTAELEGRLDTIDGVTAFKRSLLEELDNNISGLTQGSLNQMQYITQTYNDMADKAYQEAKEYQQNANIVNTEMSAVKGYYVDGNGNSILDSNGLPIKVPQSAPLDPVFDKETGKLIQFYYNDDGTIGATYTQVYDGNQSNMQSTIISLLENGVSTQEILKYVPNADLKTVQELAKVVNVQYRSDGMPLTYGGVNYNATTSQVMANTLSSYIANNKPGMLGGQCGAFVNDYLQEMGVGRLYKDPVEYKKAVVNSATPVKGGIAVFDWSENPNATDAQKEYGHVAIITNVDYANGTIDVLESNWKNDRTIHKNTYDMNKVYGYFDPSKSIEQYNAEGKATTGSNDRGFESGMEGYYDKYLTAKMTKDDWTHIGTDEATFKEQAVAYRDYINGQVDNVAQDMMQDIYDIYTWLTDGGTKEPSMVKMNELRFGIPTTKGFTYKKKLEQLLSSTALKKLVDLKANGATFGALSNQELGFITDASTWLDVKLNRSDFVNGIKDKFNEMASYYGLSDLETQAKGGLETGGSSKQVQTRKI